MQVSEEQLKDLLQQTGEAWPIANMLGKEERWEEARQQPQNMSACFVWELQSDNLR